VGRAEEGKRRRLARSLAAAVVSLVLLAAGSALWLQHQAAQRHAEIVRSETQLREAVTAELARAGEWQKQLRWREARAVLDQLRSRVGAEGPEDLRQSLERALANLDLGDRLGTIPPHRATPGQGKFDYPTPR